MLTVYHIFIERDGVEKWFALGLMGNEQAQLLGRAFPEVTRIETWLGDVAYESPAKRTVH